MNSRARLIALMAAALASGCASTANDQILVQSAGAAEKAEQVQQEPLDPDDPDALRCRNIRKTGTRISKKICATNRAWENSRKEGREATEDMQRRPQHGRDGG